MIHTKRFMRRLLAIPAITLALALLAAAPAVAKSQGGGDQQQNCVKGLFVHATGTLERAETPYPSAGYAITDEETGCTFALDGGDAGLEQYVGQRMEVTGSTPGKGHGPGSVGEYRALLNVQGVQPRSDGGETVTLSFEVDTKGQVPRNTTFRGLYGPPNSDVSSVERPRNSGVSSVQLSDPDRDGTYTGVAGGIRGPVVDTGKYRVAIEQGTIRGERGSSIVYGPLVFGPQTIDLQEDRTISATVDFREQSGSGDSGDGSSGEQYDSPDEKTTGSGIEDSGDGMPEVLPDTGGVAAGGLALACGLILGGLALLRFRR